MADGRILDLTPLQRRVVVGLRRWVVGQVTNAPPPEPEPQDDDARYARRIRQKWTRGKRVSGFGDLIGILRPTPPN